MSTEKDIRNSFKKMSGENISDVIEYLKSYFKKYRNYEIFIGTDSQRIRRRKTVLYAIVICIYEIGKGAHIIYAKEKRHDIQDMYNRLWWEVEYSMKIANMIRNSDLLIDNDVLSIHLDLSANKKNLSNKLYQAAVGYVTSQGFACLTKPDASAASYAADHIVRR